MDEKFMLEALKQAKKPYKKGEIPVGAVIVENGKIISKAHNTKEKHNCCVKHAEVNAIFKACGKKKNWRLNDCIMYVTLEPCPMCASAIKQSRISKVIYGLENNNVENSKIVNEIFSSLDSNGVVENIKSSIDNNSFEILNDFFNKKRH